MHPPFGDVDASLDRFARITCRTLQVPTALVTVIDDSAGIQRFPGAAGLNPKIKDRQTPLSHSFCKYVVAERKPLVVSDARLDERLKDSPAISGLNVIAYAGYPLTDVKGEVIGSVCVIDTRPRMWTHQELEGLQDLALACSSEVAAREAKLRLRDVAAVGLTTSVVAVLMALAALVGVSTTGLYLAALVGLLSVAFGVYALRRA